MNVLGIDLGGTHLRGGRLGAIGLGPVTIADVPAAGSAEDVLAALTALIDGFVAGGSVEAIGVGVPSLVDPRTGIVRDVPHIPAWKDVELKGLLEARYRRPVQVLNDASCFVLGEQRLGAARNRADVVGITLGTGTGAGVVIDHRLLVGQNGGAGELGMLPYHEHTYEHYTSAAFFRDEHDSSGEAIFAAASAGDATARAILGDLGHHLGKLCQAAVLAYDPEVIVLGGSISQAWPFFHEAMMASLRDFPYPGSIDRLSVLPHELEHPGVLGAALFARERAQPGR
jgi:glucokinase